MAKLTREQIVTIEVLQQRGQSQSQTARILGVSEGAVRYHLRRARDGAADGRQKPSRIEQLGLAEAVAHWWQAQAEILGQQRPPSVQLLHEFLRAEHGYDGSYKSVRKFVRARYGRPPVRPFRRVETPPGAQTQSDWGEFRRVDLGDPDGPTTVYAFVMVLSHSRKEAVVWSRSMDQLAWHHVHNEAYRRLGGVAAVNRIDNLKTGIARGCGAWGRDQRAVPRLRPDDGLPRRCLRGPLARTEGEDGATRRRLQGPGRPGPAVRRPGRAPVVDRRGPGGPRDQADLPGDRPVGGGELGGREAVPAAAAGRCCPSRSTWSRRRRCTRTARSISRAAVMWSRSPMPAATVEVRGCSGRVQILDPADRRGADLVSAAHPGADLDRSGVLRRARDRQVLPPKPLGRMARKLQEIAALPVERRPVDLYAALAEVAR